MNKKIDYQKNAYRLHYKNFQTFTFYTFQNDFWIHDKSLAQKKSHFKSQTPSFKD